MAFRTKLWIDHRVQGALVGRVVIYWCAALLYFGIAAWVSIACENPTWSFSQQAKAWFETVGPWLPSAGLILPLVVYDILRLSNQFAGPVVRMRNQLVRIVQSPDCNPIALRTDDYWHDLAVPINDVQNHIRSLKRELQEDSASASSVVDASPTPSQPAQEPAEQASSATASLASRIVCRDTANLQVSVEEEESVGAS